MSDDILIKQDGPILRITLNRPDHGNGATDPMALALTEALLKAGETSRLVVLNANGKDFCVGRATMGTAAGGRSGGAALRRRQSEVIFNSYAAFRAATVPVIAVVRGLAAGYGCAIAGVADITIAAESATFQIPEMAHNIMPTMVMSALMDRVPRKDLTYLVYSWRSSAPRGRARPASSARWSRTANSTHLSPRCASGSSTRPRSPPTAPRNICGAPSPWTCRAPSTIARNIHAVINSSSEMRK